MTPIITLTTDFSAGDGFVGMMKGVIKRINPAAEIIDIAHNVPHHNIDAGAFILHNSYRYFPAGTIHVAVVDPGVGGKRRPLAAKLRNHIFIAPDNALLKYIFQLNKDIIVYELKNQDFFLEEVSSTFHGRDIFAPTAAHLSMGKDIAEVGPVISDFVRGRIKTPVVLKKYIKGTILYVDHFGNLITNVHKSQLATENICISFGNHEICGLKYSYEDVRKSNPVALVNSAGYIEIAVNQNRADRLLNLKPDDRIIITYEK